MSWHLSSVAMLAKALEAKAVSSTELAGYFLSRIQAGTRWNAFLDVNPDLTMEQAASADRIRGLVRPAS